MSMNRHSEHNIKYIFRNIPFYFFGKLLRSFTSLFIKYFELFILFSFLHFQTISSLNQCVKYGQNRYFSKCAKGTKLCILSHLSRQWFYKIFKTSYKHKTHNYRGGRKVNKYGHIRQATKTTRSRNPLI